MNQEIIHNFIQTCHAIQQKDLVSGTGGNVSFRVGDQILITPASIALETIDQDSICVVSLNDGTVLNALKPSKETLMHLQCYRERADINAVVHVHSVYSVAIASIPQFIENGKVPIYTPGYGLRIGDIPVLPYQRPGSVELAEEVSQAIIYRDSVLLANHGVVTVGKTLDGALNLIEEIEKNAKIFFITNGMAKALTSEEVNYLKELANNSK